MAGNHAPHLTSLEGTGRQLGLPQMSHAIRLGEDSTKLENVAIPTLQIHGLKWSQGNCMRNWLSAQQLRRARAAGEVGLTNQRAPRATRVEGAGGAAGPGRASNRRAERSSRRGRGAGGRDGARNTGGTSSRKPSNAASRNPSNAASKNPDDTKKPGGASAPPGLYARLTFP